MGSWPKPRPGKTPTSAGQSHREQAEHLMARGRFKEAVKEAKLARRHEPSNEHHRLLERAYLERARQLRDGGMTAAAREVSEHLVELGIQDPERIGPVIELLLSLGMSGLALKFRDRVKDPEARSRLVGQAADQAVLNPDLAITATPEIREGAQRVRRALDALAAGDAEEARAALRDEPRNSPWADWRLLVRGILASDRNDLEERGACWGRLAPERAPARIARALEGLDASGPASGTVADLSALERLAFGSPVIGPLRRLAEEMAQGRWTEVVDLLGPLRANLERIDPALAERLTRILYTPLIRAAAELDYQSGSRLLKRFTKAAAPLPIDPRWNRLWAMVWEGPQGDLQEAEPYWRAYLRDLQESAALKPEERGPAQTMVLTSLGQRFLDELPSPEPPGMSTRQPSASARQGRRHALDCLEEALQLTPTDRSALEILRDAHQDWGEPDQAAEVNRRILAAYPEDVDALAKLSLYHFDRDEPTEALETALAARRLRPLDAWIRGLEWGARVSLARQLALKRRPDDAREQMEIAARLEPEQARKPHFLARRAALELKVGQPDRAEAVIDEAQTALAEPTALWLALLIEAIRFKLPKTDRQRFEALWTAALGKKKQSETAGLMASLLTGFQAENKAYPGLASHAKKVADYIRKTTRLKYQREDLAAVCSFLGMRPADRDLFQTLARRGTRLFPEAPEFLVLLGSIEVGNLPYRGNPWRARQLFEKALPLARAEMTDNPKMAEMATKIQEFLSMLDDLTSGPMGLPMPFGPGGMSEGEDMGAPMPQELMEMLGALLGPEPDDDELDDDEAPFSPPAPRRPRSPKPKRKR